MRHILEIGPEEHAGGLAMGWVEEMMAVKDNSCFWPSWTLASSAEMGKTPWGRNGFGQGNQELALDKFSLRILLVIPVEVSGIQLAMSLLLWGEASFL